jgi:hypothetical protein
MAWKSRDQSILNLIKLSLKDIYCGTTLSNYDIIRLIHRLTNLSGVIMKWILSLIYI